MILNNNGKIVLPDVLVNAGSAVAGYFEWLHDMQGRNFKSGEIEKLLQDRMFAAFNDVQAAAAQHSSSLREAAYMLAINKLSEAMKDRK